MFHQSTVNVLTSSRVYSLLPPCIYPRLLPCICAFLVTAMHVQIWRLACGSEDVTQYNTWKVGPFVERQKVFASLQHKAAPPYKAVSKKDIRSLILCSTRLPHHKTVSEKDIRSSQHTRLLPAIFVYHVLKATCCWPRFVGLLE